MNNDTDFSARGPINQQRCERATEWMVHNAVNIGEAKANRERCENMLRVVKALSMKASDEKSAAAQEREAYASDQYMTALDNLFEATKTHETLVSKRYAAQALIEVWRSINTSLRGARV